VGMVVGGCGGAWAGGWVGVGVVCGSRSRTKDRTNGGVCVRSGVCMECPPISRNPIPAASTTAARTHSTHSTRSTRSTRSAAPTAQRGRCTRAAAGARRRRLQRPAAPRAAPPAARRRGSRRWPGRAPSGSGRLRGGGVREGWGEGVGVGRRRGGRAITATLSLSFPCRRSQGGNATQCSRNANSVTSWGRPAVAPHYTQPHLTHLRGSWPGCCRRP
jgi:hypothetical protein